MKIIKNVENELLKAKHAADRSVVKSKPQTLTKITVPRSEKIPREIRAAIKLIIKYDNGTL